MQNQNFEISKRSLSRGGCEEQCPQPPPPGDAGGKGCNITPRTSIGNISSISELIQPFPRSVYAETNENSRNEVPMDVRGVMLQCLPPDGIGHWKEVGTFIN